MSIPTVVRVHPAPLAGLVHVPGDKSLSHRALLIGALVGGPVSVDGIAPSGDALSMVACLRSLGVDVSLREEDTGLSGDVTGPLREASDVLDCGNAGTAMRLLAGAVAGLDALTVLTGDASLRQRPMGRVLEPLRAMGATVDGRAGGDRAPIVIRGGDLRGIRYTSPVASAQIKSALLLAGLQAEGTTRVTSPLPSRDHTERLLGYLGRPVDVRIGSDGSETVEITPGPLRPRAVHVAGDPSAAAFWLVAGAIAGTAVRIPDVCVNPRRIGALAVLKDLGTTITRSGEAEPSGEPIADLALAEGASLDGRAEVTGRRVVDALDELPVLAVAGAVATGGLTVRDAAELRVKESDRITGIERVFDALGLTVTAFEDGFAVPGGQTIAGGGRVNAGGDHRIAMTAAVAATAAAEPVEIRGFGSVPTSYPDFLAHLEALGGQVEVLESVEDEE
jgi:3-phosphoshikimate 1-carboxyvinyltransferase